MTTLGAEEIYEQHIKSLPPVERLRLVEIIAHEIAMATKSDVKPKRRLLELEGVGADLWQGIDAQEYVNELRKAWDHRP
jgi:hypothetical protein